MEPQRDEVLVIDGAEDVRAVLRDILEAEGYQVRVARDTEAGVRLLHHSAKRMAVLFGVAPLASLTREQTGLGLLDAIAQDPQCLGRHAYIMLTTAPERAVAMAAGLPTNLHMTVLREPFDVDYLLRTLEEVAPSTGVHGVQAVGRLAG